MEEESVDGNIDDIFEEEVYEEEYETEIYADENDVVRYLSVDEEYPLENRFIESNSDAITVDSNYKSRYTGESFDYTEEKKQEKKAEPTPSTVKPKTNVPVGGALKLLFNIVLVLAIGLVVFILYKIIADFRGVKQYSKVPIEVNPNEQNENEIEELDESDLKHLLQKAIADKNFALATRYYFLLYLEKLQVGDFISYNKDKTNSDYYSEIKDEYQADQFIRVSYLFEYIWYGKKAVNESEFSEVEKIFIQKIKG